MNSYKYIPFFPKPFLEDLVKERVLPFIGAGFSKNAEIPEGKKMLDWNELGQEFADDIIDYKYTSAIDAISAYSHEYNRSGLVEKLGKALLVHQAKPGNTHKAFCNLQFDVVCTTNFEFLLEKGYNLISKPYNPIIDEEQLAIAHEKEEVTLLKIHGDLNHPARLVATEEDYDKFLNSYPMLATYLANLLITRTALFIGYSLDDTDFRQIWQLIKDRLGNLRRQAYVLKINCSSNEKTRYARRGVKVIDIPGDPSEYPQILEHVFKELGEYWTESVLRQPLVVEDQTLAELFLPEGSNNRLCFFSVPAKFLAFYKKLIYPIVYDHGLIPISADDIIVAGDNWLAKVTALIKRSEFFIVDLASKNTIFELGLAMSKNEDGTLVSAKSNILIINEKDVPIPSSFIGLPYLSREPDPFDSAEAFTSQVSDWLTLQLEPLKLEFESGPNRLLEKQEYRAAVIAAISLLEIQVRRKLESSEIKYSQRATANNLYKQALDHQLLSLDEYENIKQWVMLRNKAVHSNAIVDRQSANAIVEGVYSIIERINN